ncbi:hypothetical protein ACLKA7_015595 [Drosophila subpalustris]
MDPSECSCQLEMKAFESHSESELESGSTHKIKDGELSSDELDTERVSYKKEYNKYKENSLVSKEILLPSIVQAEHTSDKHKSQEKEREGNSPNERHSLSIVSEVQASNHKEESLPKKSEDNPHVSKKLNSLPIIEEDHTSEKNKESRLEERGESQLILINEDQTSKNKEESRLKEREDRPLVLEARHSLSIAETKKRRASVYCDGNLFIPKELARGEVHQRRYSSAVNSLDQISRNRDYCIRMLKFPVGLGRARYVAQQLKRKKSKERKIRTEFEFEGNVDSRIKEETLSMPNLYSEQADTNQLYSDDECCIVLEEIVDVNGTGTEDDGTDELIERVSKRQRKRASSLELRCSKDSELVVEIQDQQHLPVFRWHIPDCNESITKMGPIGDVNNKNAESQEGFSDEQRVTVEEIREEPPEVELQQQQQPLQLSRLAAMEQEQQNFQVEHIVDDPQQQQQQQLQHQRSQSQQHVAAVPIESQVGDSPLRQHLMHRIILPRIHTDELPQPNRVNNNAVNLCNQNLQQHYVESLVPNELLEHCSKEHYGKYAFTQTAPQEQQLSHTLQQQQSDYLWQQQQYQSSYQEQQHLEARREKLQQLNEHYQRLKSQEDERLRSINKSLKDVYADRLISERQHAEYHRMFMHKMVESKKQEESLQAQKEHIKRQFMAELANLEQHIAEKRRQLQERSWAYQWQQQQYQQQKQQHHELHQQQHRLAFNQQQQQQQYFLPQLQLPAYQSSLQCIQEADYTPTSHTGPSVGVHSGLMAPPLPAPPPPPPPPPTAYRAEHLQSAVALEANARIFTSATKARFSLVTCNISKCNESSSCPTTLCSARDDENL